MSKSSEELARERRLYNVEKAAAFTIMENGSILPETQEVLKEYLDGTPAEELIEKLINKYKVEGVDEND